ncbi:hypothetical protein [Jiella sp. M17.18]|uniref:hypothetical protein n=1 Tax=Jiella sp. M17.18 TaxID=3234247 RepID=UPI0034DFDF4E
MDKSEMARERAEALMPGPPARAEKGSAGVIIAAEAKATQEKTARLRKLRLERDAATPPVEAAPKRAAAKTTRSRKKAAG